MKTKIIVLIAAFSAGVVFAGDTPSWDDLAKLYGQAVDSTNMISFAQRYELKKYSKFDEGGFNPENYSFSLLFKRNAVHCIILHVAKRAWGDKNWTSYAAELPFGLTPTNTLGDVIGEYGKPTAEPGMWFIGDFKVWPHFENGTNTISEIYIWRTNGPNKVPEDTARKLADPQH